MTELLALLELLNKFSPLGLAALLAVIVVFLLVKGGTQMDKLQNNHLHDLPEMRESLQRIEVTLAGGFSELKTVLRERKPRGKR
jgi:hypothetical protein